MAVVEILRPSDLADKSHPEGGENKGSRPESFSIPAIVQMTSSPDFVLVWSNAEKEAMTQTAFEKRSVFEYNLEEEGLILQWENSDKSPELHVVKIWAPLEVLKRYSEILKLRLPMKQLKLAEQGGDADDQEDVCPLSQSTRLASLKKSQFVSSVKCCWEGATNMFRITLDPMLFPKKCRRLTEIYSRDKEYLFDVDESNMDQIFPISIRARIVQYILRRKAYKNAEELERDAFAFGYERLVQQGVYEAGYPLHDGSISAKGSTRNLLYENWAKLSTFLKHQPLDTVRDYFGVNIALYFAWLGYYTRMLIFAAIFGLACFWYGIATFSTDQFVQDVCNKSLDITMCPMCDTACGYWKLHEKCSYSKFAYLFDNDLTVLYSLFMSIWAACFLEFWKRYSTTMTYRWDLSSFDLKDFNPRPEYVAELKKIYPKGHEKSHPYQAEAVGDEEEGQDKETKEKAKFDFDLSIPFWRRKLPFSIVSYSAVMLLVVMALAALIGVILYRLWFTLWLSKEDLNDKNGFAYKGLTVSITAAFINLSFIMIFGKIYERIAVKLTEMEYSRTQPEFEASYTVKVYLLQFINNYSSIFYVAFFKGCYAGAPHKYHKLFGVLRQEECGISCMPELCIQLAVIMIGKQSRSMIIEAVIPWIKRFCKKVAKKCRVGTSTTVTENVPESRKTSLQNEPIQWAKDYDLLEWGTFSLTDEYLEMVLQFGFVTIFVSAFPLAPFFALLNNIFELRIDAGKLLVHYRRPVGIRVKNIGVWADIVEGIVKIAVVSNACIIALTSNFIPKLMYRYFLQDESSPNYGTLHGYLNNSLTPYNTADLETKPARYVIERMGDSSICYFPTYRYDSRSPHKYEFRVEHWQIWLARVIFVILFENVVAVIIIFLRWLIPHVPRKLHKKMQREERLVNELIVQQELARSHKTWSTRHLIRPKSQSQQLLQPTRSGSLQNDIDTEKDN